MMITVQGTIMLEDGTTSQFLVEDSHGYRQWGADTERLNRTIRLVEAIAEAVEDEEERTA